MVWECLWYTRSEMFGSFAKKKHGVFVVAFNGLGMSAFATLWGGFHSMARRTWKDGDSSRSSSPEGIPAV